MILKEITMKRLLFYPLFNKSPILLTVFRNIISLLTWVLNQNPLVGSEMKDKFGYYQM